MKHIRKHALLGFAIADANPTYTVRTVYFQATDAPNPTREIIKLLIETQDFYRNEMERHGYGAETFKLETDDAGNVGFYPIHGKYNTDHYLTDTYNRVRNELPPQLTRGQNAQDNVLITIVGGIHRISTGKRAFGGYFTGNNVGGVAIIAGEALIFELLVHEIGHTFGLKHTTDPSAIMYAGSEVLLDYEARWLDRHHLFNDTHIRNGTPQFVESLPIVAIGDDKLRFRIIAESENGLYQAQLTRGKSPNRIAFVLGTAEIDDSDRMTSAEGYTTTIEVDIHRQNLIDGDSVELQIMDIHGNTAYKMLHNITLPHRTPAYIPQAKASGFDAKD